jgi:hypothetical protein
MRMLLAARRKIRQLAAERASGEVSASVKKL